MHENLPWDKSCICVSKSQDSQCGCDWCADALSLSVWTFYHNADICWDARRNGSSCAVSEFPSGWTICHNPHIWTASLLDIGWQFMCISLHSYQSGLVISIVPVCILSCRLSVLLLGNHLRQKVHFSPRFFSLWADAWLSSCWRRENDAGQCSHRNILYSPFSSTPAFLDTFW